MTDRQARLLADFGAMYGPAVLDPEDLEAIRAVVEERAVLLAACEAMLAAWKENSFTIALDKQLNEAIAKAKAGPR